MSRGFVLPICPHLLPLMGLAGLGRPRIQSFVTARPSLQ
jgi:hypothetical protein